MSRFYVGILQGKLERNKDRAHTLHGLNGALLKLTDSAFERRLPYFDRATARLKVVAVVLIWLAAGQLAFPHHDLGSEVGNQALLCGVCTVSADGIRTTTPPTV